MRLSVFDRRSDGCRGRRERQAHDCSAKSEPRRATRMGQERIADEIE